MSKDTNVVDAERDGVIGERPQFDSKRLRGHLQRSGTLDPLAKLRPSRRRIPIVILIVDRQVSDFDDAELQRRGGDFGKRVGHFSVD